MPGKQRVRQSRKRPMHRKKRGPSNKTLNKKIHHIENQLIETKFFDQFVNGTALAGAGVSDYLTAIAQGDTALTRTGNVIWPTSVQIRLDISTDIDLLSSTQIRLILFWDHQPDGAAPVLTGANTTQSLLDIGTILDSTIAPRNYNTIKRYTVLFDKRYTIVPQVVATTVAGATTQVLSITKQVDIFKKLSRQVKYNNTSGAITAAVTNALHFALFCDTVTDAPTYQAGYRLYFKDA